MSFRLSNDGFNRLVNDTEEYTYSSLHGVWFCTNSKYKSKKWMMQPLAFCSRLTSIAIQKGLDPDVFAPKKAEVKDSKGTNKTKKSVGKDKGSKDFIPLF